MPFTTLAVYLLLCSEVDGCSLLLAARATFWCSRLGIHAAVCRNPVLGLRQGPRVVCLHAPEGWELGVRFSAEPAAERPSPHRAAALPEQWAKACTARTAPGCEAGRAGDI
mmetsp:Transcript_9416/g.22210  ORF Transcript_9416/g.22210 Transcript_9416/m.22210 type:complete len:111 (-) Transcript_9416:82-414(-)